MANWNLSVEQRLCRGGSPIPLVCRPSVWKSTSLLDYSPGFWSLRSGLWVFGSVMGALVLDSESSAAHVLITMLSHGLRERKKSSEHRCQHCEFHTVLRWADLLPVAQHAAAAR